MAQSCGTFEIPVSQLTDTLTLRVTGMRRWKRRMLIGAKLIRLGAYIAGLKVEVVDAEN